MHEKEKAEQEYYYQTKLPLGGRLVGKLLDAYVESLAKKMSTEM